MSQTISGSYTNGVILSGNPATVSSSGTIRTTADNAGGIYGPMGTTWALTNAGLISATGVQSYGVEFADSGSVTNAATGTIAGDRYGLLLDGGGSVTNRAGGTISGYYAITALNARATVANAGMIAGNLAANDLNADGIFLEAGGAVTNQSSGTISGYNDGIRIAGGSGTVLNLGHVNAAMAPSGVDGIYLADGGVVTNGRSGGTVSSAYISGNTFGIDFGGTGAGTVTNFGTIGSLRADTGVRMATGTIVNGPSGATGAQIEGTGSGAVVDGAGTVINYGTILGGTIGSDGATSSHGVKLGDSATLSNLGSASLIRAFIGVYGASNDTVSNAGTIAASDGATGIALEFGSGTNRLIAAPGAVFIGAVHAAGATTLELASASSTGTLTGLGNSFTNFTSLVFDTGAQWTVAGDADADGLGTLNISGFAAGDTIDLTGFLAVSETFANNALVLTSAGNANTTLNIQGDFTTAALQIASDGSGGTNITVVCFAAGTLIDTPAGEVQVEKLKVGDLVATAHHGPRPVRWIGKGNVRPTRGRRTAATPVIVRKGALGENMPHQDLRVTMAHGLYIDDVLIPVEFLVNHRSIIWDDHAQEVEIYHVELESHDLLIANGIPAESYRDDGNRWLFQNADSGSGRPQEPCAPVLTGGPVVDAVWQRLLRRAGPRRLPPMTDDPDLHLIVDGRRVDAQGCDGMVRTFRLPGQPGSVHIASREVVPAELGLARDPRALGVALRRIAVCQGTQIETLPADDARLTDGFHGFEEEGGMRWTNGYAALPLTPFAQFTGAVDVVLTLAGTTTYPDDGYGAEERRDAARTAAEPRAADQAFRRAAA